MSSSFFIPPPFSPAFVSHFRLRDSVLRPCLLPVFIFRLLSFPLSTAARRAAPLGCAPFLFSLLSPLVVHCLPECITPPSLFFLCLLLLRCVATRSRHTGTHIHTRTHTVPLSVCARFLGNFVCCLSHCHHHHTAPFSLFTSPPFRATQLSSKHPHTTATQEEAVKQHQRPTPFCVPFPAVSPSEDPSLFSLFSLSST